MMRIDSLSAAQDRAGKYKLQLSDGTILKLYRQTIEDFGLYTGMEMTEEDFRKLKSSAGQMSAKMRAVRIVSASSISKSDLEQRLIHKGESSKDARDAVQWMTELDLVDDRKTAEQIIFNCIRKGYGISRAKQALYEKRIPRDLWPEVLTDYPDQKDKILSFLKSHLSDDATDRDVRRVVEALLRRGHSYSHIRHALTQLSLDSDTFPEE